MRELCACDFFSWLSQFSQWWMKSERFRSLLWLSLPSSMILKQECTTTHSLATTMTRWLCRIIYLPLLISGFQSTCCFTPVMGNSLIKTNQSPNRYAKLVNQSFANYNFLLRGAHWSSGCVLDCQVRGPSWIQISPLLCLLDHKSEDTRASPKPGTHLEWEKEEQANGCWYFGSKEKNTKEILWHRNRKEDRKTSRHGKKTKEKALGTNGLCAQGLKMDIISVKSCLIMIKVSCLNS